MNLRQTIGILGLVSVLQMITLCASVPYFQEPPELNITLDGGYREDWLKFHIGGDCRSHKNFSKVEWQNLKIAEIAGSINYSTCHNYYMRASGDYGRILNGTGRVTNKWIVGDDNCCQYDRENCRKERRKRRKKYIKYCQDNPQCCPNGTGFDIDSDERRRRRNRCPSLGKHGEERCPGTYFNYDSCDCRIQHDKHPCEIPCYEYSKQSADADDGYVCDLSGGLGWKVVSGGGRSWIAGLIGYSYERQSLRMKHFRQTRDSQDQIVPEALNRVRSSYRTRWTGPFVGVDFLSKIECNVMAFGTFEWHVCDYRGEGVWQRTPAYKAKISHHARGYGAVATLGFDWAPWNHWGFGLVGNYQQWSTRKGSNRSKTCSQLFADSQLPRSFPVAEKSRLNRVKWITWSLLLTTTYRY